MPFIISVFKCFCFCLKTPFQFLQILRKVSYRTYVWHSSTLNNGFFFNLAKMYQDVRHLGDPWISQQKHRLKKHVILGWIMSGRKTRALFVDFMIPISRGVYNEHVTIVTIFWSFKKWHETTNSSAYTLKKNENS